LYATCSYLPRENDRVVEAFLASHPDAASVAIYGPWGEATRHGRQVLPGADGMDGFYYAMLGRH
ncbi:MAG: 16S rRNA (cytosine(967)-C(5))-methyltransferase RsmB, partial [Gammaproteobacteria bacterium]|nr:16S rRNA (cytosine(967)-C(5))-methyltransferase RsmB [Gammaproteobacteria bacterium]